MWIENLATDMISRFLEDRAEESRLREALLAEIEAVYDEAHRKEIEAVDQNLEEYEPIDYLGETFDQNRSNLGLLSKDEIEALHNFYDGLLEAEDPLPPDIRKDKDPVSYRYAFLKDEAWKLRDQLWENYRHKDDLTFRSRINLMSEDLKHKYRKWKEENFD
jgi:hypothetical protein